jgi:hypothetical protein
MDDRVLPRASEPAMSESRSRALDHIVSLAREHRLTASEIGAALTAEAPTASGSRAQTLLVRAAAYLGGTFVFAGIAAFIALQWDAMSAAARVVITLGPGLAAFALAALATGDRRFAKAIPPLFLIAAVLEPTGMLVAFSEFGSGGDPRVAALITAGVVGVQFGLVFVVLGQSMLLFLAVLFGMLFWMTAFDLLDMDGELVALVLGGSLLLAAIGAGRTRHASITPPWYFAGGIAFLAGLFALVERTPFEILFIIAGSGFVYLSAAIQSRTLLIVATAAILAYTGWFTSQHFADSLGWPLALVLFGLLLISLSALAFRIDRQYIRSRS